MVRRFRRKTSLLFLIFLNEPIAGTLKHAYKKIRANVRRSDSEGPLLSHI